MGVISRISCHNFIKINNIAFFSNWFYNGLFEVSLETGKTIFRGSFEGEKLSQDNIHSEIFIKNGMIYFCPGKGQYVHIYDTQNCTMDSVKIKKNSEKNLTIKKVILNENILTLIPEQKEFTFREIDLHALAVREINTREELKGEYLINRKYKFPSPDVLDKEDIERKSGFCWKPANNKVWYGFLPMGMQLLRYTEGMTSIEKLPLVVLNELMLEEHLSKVRKELLETNVVSEKRMELQEFIKGIERGHYTKNKNERNIIWERIS